MATDSAKTVSFTVDSAAEKQRITEYAREKGLRDAATLARFALYQYMGRYPLKKPQGGTASAAGGEKIKHPGGTDGEVR